MKSTLKHLISIYLDHSVVLTWLSYDKYTKLILRLSKNIFIIFITFWRPHLNLIYRIILHLDGMKDFADSKT